jgi:hypothetical protein
MGHEKVSFHGLLREAHTYRKTGSESNKSRKPAASHERRHDVEAVSGSGDPAAAARAGADPAAKTNRLSFVGMI